MKQSNNSSFVILSFFIPAENDQSLNNPIRVNAEFCRFFREFRSLCGILQKNADNFFPQVFYGVRVNIWNDLM